MVKAEEGKVKGEGKALGGAESDHEGWRQSRTLGSGDGVQIGGREFGLAQGGLEDGANVLEVLPGG